MDSSRAARATSFGAWADDYDQWRPGYPDAAVRLGRGDHRAPRAGRCLRPLVSL